SFGNISQAPQIIKGFGMDSCAFGRGMAPVGYNNTVTDKQVVGSEFNWFSPDGSSIMAVLFAHWYHNAIEIPSDHDKAVEYVKKLIADTDSVSGTPHLLGMNGCDHQPVQHDVGDIIESIKADFPDVDIVHSNFAKYMDSIRKYSADFPVISGELYGQNTSGYFTLINTASSRIYMKQANHLNQLTLEKQSEPMSVISSLFGDEYRYDLLNYAWKEMLKNHAHDSICGCSADAVHRECMSRFEKSTAVAESVRDSALNFAVSHINTANMPDALGATVVFNPNGQTGSQTVTAIFDLPLEDTAPIGEYAIFNARGEQIECDIVDLGRTFDYYLPRYTFRVHGYYRRLSVTFCAENVGAVGYSVFYLKKAEKQLSGSLSLKGNTAENDYIKISVNEDGSFDLYDKKSARSLENVGYFEDMGDCGDEYSYAPPKNDQRLITLGKKADIEAKKSNTEIVFTIRTSLDVPVTTDSEKRSDESTKIDFVSVIRLAKESKMAEVSCEINNTADNHRVRVIFPNNIDTDTVFVDGQYDLLSRPIYPGKQWVNPDNSQRQQAFFMLCDKDSSMVVANRGLCEYEILRDGKNTAALTALRCVAHIGDWGVFPTPEAQCKGKNVASYAVGICSGENDEMRKEAYAFATGEMLTYKAKTSIDGSMAEEFSFAELKGKNTILSAVKKAEDDDCIIVRFYNPSESDEEIELDLGIDFAKAYKTNLNEKIESELAFEGRKLKMNSPKKKITTIKLEK
ncbi:MAG: alpha-mannosidase, partial [Clostridia bacterium]|nr:alpha-mannosidase [Clostridia bacterium]